ncbi:MAG: mechanosensitive ion channel [Candidatus Aureabacteria bacterium]|nr:mechanosensitive ion channel [Candidatus Auribacterota bacterium]
MDTHRRAAMSRRYRDKASAMLFIIPVLLLSTIRAIPALDEETAQWHTLITRGHKLFTRDKEILDSMAREIPSLYPATQQRLTGLAIRFQRLMVIYNVHWKSPFYSMDMEEQLRAIEFRTDEIIAPLEKYEKTLSAMERFILSMDETKESLSEAGFPTIVFPPSMNKEVAQFKNEKNEIQAHAASMKEQLQGPLQQARLFRSKLAEFGKEIDGDLGDAVRSYYLAQAPHLFSPRTWGLGYTHTLRWIYNFSTVDPAFNQYDDSLWLKVIMRFAIAAGLLIIAAQYLLRKIRTSLEFPRIVHALFPPTIWIALWAAILIAIHQPEFIRSEFLFMASLLFLSRGMISLACRVNEVSTSELKGSQWMITPLWIGVVIGNILQSLHMPAVPLSIVWSVTLLTIWWCHLRRCAGKKPEEYAERLLAHLFIPCCILGALAGWGNLSILFSTVLLAVYISAALGQGIGAARSKLYPVLPKARGRAFHPRFVDPLVNFPNVFIISSFIGLAMYIHYLGDGRMFDALSAMQFKWRNISFPLVNIPLLIAAYFAVRSFVAIVHELIFIIQSRKEGMQEGAILSLQALSAYLLWFLYGMAMLSMTGFTAGHLAMIAGGLSVGIGFGMQHIVNNLICGLILLFGRDIQPGDLIERDGTFSRVQKVTIRNTILRSEAGKTVIAPNSEFVTKSFANWTYRDPRIRVPITVRVAAGSDGRKVEELLLKIARDTPRVLKIPPPSVRMEDFGGGRLEFALRVWLAHPGDWKVVSDLRYEIDSAFKKNGITLG